MRGRPRQKDVITSYSIHYTKLYDHPHLVRHLRQGRGRHFVPDQPRWTVRPDQMRKGGLQFGIAAHQGIVFGIRNLGRVIGVVEPVVLCDSYNFV